MKPFFDNQFRLDELNSIAAMWMGTQWCPNSDVIGRGVSCHNLPRAIYVACGALAPGFPKIVGDPTQDRQAKTSRMEEFLDGRVEFQRAYLNAIRPGDLLGIRIYKCIDHLGVALPNGLFVHVLMHKHTSADTYGIPPWQQRIEAIWRPVEED